MLKRNGLLAGVVLALAAPGPGYAQEAKADTVVATVNGAEIKLGHMIMTWQALPEQYRQLPQDVLFDGILEQLVQQTVLAQSLGEDVPAMTQLALDNEERQVLASVAVQDLLVDVVNEETLSAAYEEQFADQEPGTEYNAAHILVETEEAALDAIARLEEGADFAELARELSTGPSGPNGGDLGWFGEGVMVTDFEAAVTKLDVGDVSEPVETQFGWHVITLKDMRISEVPTLEEVRAQLAEQIQQAAVETAVAALEEKADITRIPADQIDASAISNIELISE